MFDEVLVYNCAPLHCEINLWVIEQCVYTCIREDSDHGCAVPSPKACDAFYSHDFAPHGFHFRKTEHLVRHLISTRKNIKNGPFYLGTTVTADVHARSGNALKARFVTLDADQTRRQRF